jgi:hypothetical protein
VSIQSCCEFSGYDCNYYDDSYITIDSDSYSFREENISVTDIYENDSLIFIHYSISQEGDITGSNVNIGYGFIIKLEIKKLSEENFIFDSGTVEFIENNIWGDFYYFESQNLNLIEYVNCKCQKEVGNSVMTPERLFFNLKGIISNDTKRKVIELEIQYETNKIEVKDC